MPCSDAAERPQSPQSAAPGRAPAPRQQRPPTPLAPGPAQGRQPQRCPVPAPLTAPPPARLPAGLGTAPPCPTAPPPSSPLSTAQPPCAGGGQAPGSRAAPPAHSDEGQGATALPTFYLGSLAAPQGAGVREGVQHHAAVREGHSQEAQPAHLRVLQKHARALSLLLAVVRGARAPCTILPGEGKALAGTRNSESPGQSQSQPVGWHSLSHHTPTFLEVLGGSQAPLGQNFMSQTQPWSVATA